jgi:hypothetical protein
MLVNSVVNIILIKIYKNSILVKFSRNFEIEFKEEENRLRIGIYEIIK